MPAVVLAGARVDRLGGLLLVNVHELAPRVSQSIANPSLVVVLKAAATVEHVDDLAPHLRSDDRLPTGGVKDLDRKVGASVEEELHLAIIGVGHALGTVGLLTEREVCDLTQVEVIGVQEVEALTEGILTEPW